MTDQNNKRLVQEAYRSFQTGDVPSVLAMFTPDVLWQLPAMPDVPFAGVWRGPEQVAKFFQILAEVQDIVEFEPGEFIAAGDRVVVLGRFSMRVKATGRLAESDWVHVWTVRDGKVTSVREYVDSLAVNRAHAVSPS